MYTVDTYKIQIYKMKIHIICRYTYSIYFLFPPASLSFIWNYFLKNFICYFLLCKSSNEEFQFFPQKMSLFLFCLNVSDHGIQGNLCQSISWTQAKEQRFQGSQMTKNSLCKKFEIVYNRHTIIVFRN